MNKKFKNSVSNWTFIFDNDEEVFLNTVCGEVITYNSDGTKTFIYDVKDKLKEFLPELKADIGHNHNKTKITEMLTDEIIKYIKKQTSCNTGTGNDNN